MRTTYSGPQILSTRQERAADIGMIVGAWAAVERQMIEAYSYVARADGWLAAEIFEEVRKLSPRTAIFCKAVERQFGRQAAKEARAILTQLSAISKERDKVAHGFFITSDDYPDALILVQGWGKETRHFLYDADTFRALIAEVYRLAALTADLFIGLMFSAPPRYEPGRWIFPQPVDLRSAHPDQEKEP